MRNSVNLWNWNPSRDVFGFTPVLESLFGDQLDRETRKVTSAAVLTPACDIEETESHFLISLDMPGIVRDQIRIEVADDQLVITGERKSDSKEAKGNRFFSERGYGKFHRAFTLGTAVDKDKIEAAYTDGVLRVAIPKAEAVKPKQIKVEGEEKAGFFDKLVGRAKTEDVKSVH
jgi:HSP20 family protein